MASRRPSSRLPKCSGCDRRVLVTETLTGYRCGNCGTRWAKTKPACPRCDLDSPNVCLCTVDCGKHEGCAVKRADGA